MGLRGCKFRSFGLKDRGSKGSQNWLCFRREQKAFFIRGLDMSGRVVCSSLEKFNAALDIVMAILNPTPLPSASCPR